MAASLEILATRCRRQRCQRIGKARGAMRHPVQALRAEALPDPASAPVRADPVLAQQMLAAPHGPHQHIVGPGVAVQAKQRQNGAGAAADHVEPLVGRDQVVGDELRSGMGVREQAVVAEGCSPSRSAHKRSSPVRPRRRSRANAQSARRCGPSAFGADRRCRRAQARRTARVRRPVHARRGTRRSRRRRYRDRARD